MIVGVAACALLTAFSFLEFLDGEACNPKRMRRLVVEIWDA
jgi:hypothetical protein